MSTLTIRLDERLEKQLEKLARDTGRSKSELVREAVRRQLSVSRLAAIRAKVMPHAARAGYLLDEDVFRDVS